MPQTVGLGSQGSLVRHLQDRLNKALPLTPVLAVDGVFGPLTLNRVRRFQIQHELTVDGVVGPITWDAIEKTASGAFRPITRRIRAWNQCGCAAIWKRGIDASFVAISTKLVESRVTAAGQPAFADATDSDRVGDVAGIEVTRVPDSILAILNPVYGSSIDYDNVRMTNQSGIGGRAFVLTVYKSPLPRRTAISFVNIGTDTRTHTLIHEFGHVWQAQHHSDPTAYMVNALASQGLEEAKNAADRTDQWSAYAYKTGKRFEEYGAEQIAQMIANGETAIIGRVRSAAKWVVDDGLIPTQLTPFVENVSHPGVKI